MTKKKLLLHTCCAPCTAPVFELLAGEYEISLFYCNPNIAPYGEYRKRLEELIGYAELMGINIIEHGYDVRQWTSSVKNFRREGEQSERCWNCYRYRLDRTFRYAIERGYDHIATTLSISPHKDAVKINEIGNELVHKYKVSFYEADFKKNDGFKRSLELSKRYNFYRQNYCGCVYSREERRKNSAWLNLS